MLFIISCLVGMFVGFLGAAFNWSSMRTLTIAILSGIGVSILFMGAQASELAVKNLTESTVHLSIGTGSIIQGKHGKYLLTNWHVCNSATWKGEIKASAENGEIVTGPVVKTNPLFDLCVAKIETSRKGLELGPQPAPFQNLNSRGYPEGVLTESHGQLLGVTNWTYIFDIAEVGECFKGSNPELGYDGKVHGCAANYTSSLTNLYSRPGSSGSPVTDESGKIVGVVSSWHPVSNFEAGMVPYDQLKEFFRGL